MLTAGKGKWDKSVPTNGSSLAMIMMFAASFIDQVVLKTLKRHPVAKYARLVRNVSIIARLEASGFILKGPALPAGALGCGSKPLPVASASPLTS